MRISFCDNFWVLLVNWCCVYVGIVYAHRNEDVVNSRPGIQEKKHATTRSNDGLSEPSISSAHRRKKPDCVTKKQKLPLIDERKRTQYSLLAQFMGMGELAFSKWLLSASPLEREKVLVDYKKKKKIPHGWKVVLVGHKTNADLPCIAIYNPKTCKLG